MSFRLWLSLLDCKQRGRVEEEKTGKQGTEAKPESVEDVGRITTGTLSAAAATSLTCVKHLACKCRGLY